MDVPDEVRSWMSEIGKRGKGDKKVRGDKSYYSEMAYKSHKKRRQKHKEKYDDSGQD